MSRVNRETSLDLQPKSLITTSRLKKLNEAILANLEDLGYGG